MKVLVIGTGGREHALAKTIALSTKVNKVYVSNGNKGMIDKKIEIISLKSDDLIIDFCKNKEIDLVVIGPEDPLVNGLGDKLRDNDILVFGPNKDLAMLEGSKYYAKEFMKKYNVATAKYESFNDINKAKDYVIKMNCPLVVKASGLAQGKGVIICKNKQEAIIAIDEIMGNKKFKDAGNVVVIEEMLVGKETSILSIYDGHNIYPMLSSMDHKKIGEGETGLNTGGMGTISPSPYFTESIEDDFNKNILIPTLEGLKKEGFTTSACIFFGLMLTDKGVKLLEYNLRFGDPETQSVLSLLDSDLFNILYKASLGSTSNNSLLIKDDLKFKDKTAITFIVAAQGYPESNKKGIELNFKEDKDNNIKLFYAGVKEDDKGKLISSGGRILGVTTIGENKEIVREKILKYLDENPHNNTVFRRDIGNV